MEPLHSGPMTTETAAQERTHSWRAPQTLAAAVVAAVIGGLGGAAIYAATEGSPHAMGGGPYEMSGGTHAPPHEN